MFVLFNSTQDHVFYILFSSYKRKSRKMAKNYGSRPPKLWRPGLEVTNLNLTSCKHEHKKIKSFFKGSAKGSFLRDWTHWTLCIMKFIVQLDMKLLESCSLFIVARLQDICHNSSCKEFCFNTRPSTPISRLLTDCFK